MTADPFRGFTDSFDPQGNIIFPLTFESPGLAADGGWLRFRDRRLTFKDDETPFGGGFPASGCDCVFEGNVRE